MSLVDLYTKSTPKTAKIDAKGTDKTPIEGSKKLTTDLSKPRHGAIGQGAGGYDNKKVYSTSIKNK